MNRRSRGSPARLYFHRGTPATFAFIPAGIPRSPRDSRHPHSRAGLWTKVLVLGKDAPLIAETVGCGEAA